MRWHISGRLAQFALASLVGLLLIGMLTAVYTRDVATAQLHAQGVDQHETLSRTLAATMGSDVLPVLDGAIPTTSLRDHPMVRNLRRYLVDPLHDMKVVRIKVYDRTGRTVFSTDESQIGQDGSRNEGFLAALGGEVESELVHRNTFNVSDGVIEDRDMIETYVPIRASAASPIMGVFEVYSDMTDLMMLAQETQRRVVLGSLLICAAVFAVLLLLFRRVDRSLQNEQGAAVRYLREVQDARENLEAKVHERTRELAVSERRFQDVADAVGEYIWETDAAGRFTFISARVESVLGYPPEELLGRAPLELAPDEDAQWVRAYFGEHGGDGPFSGLEHRSRTRDGRLVWLSVSAVPVRDERGRFRGHRGAAHDITTRKQAQENLRKMSLAIEQSSEIVIITDPHGRIEYVNQAFVTSFGYLASEALGNTPRMLRAGAQPDSVYEDLWRTIRDGNAWRGELCNRSRDGVLFWNLVSIFPLRDEKGGVTHFVGLQTDVTQRKHDEQALMASEARLRAVTDSVADAIITASPEGVIDMVNPAANALFGYVDGELIGRHLSILMPAPYRDEHDGYMRRYLHTGRGRIIGVGRREVVGLRKDGSEIALELAVGEIRSGSERRFVGVLRDLTEAKRAQRDLERARQQYFHREKIAAMGQLAAGIVHEVGNPTAAISGAASVLLQRAAADPTKVDEILLRNLELIAEQSDRIAAMTREISDFARPREVRHSLLDLNQVVRSAVSIMRFDPRVQDSQFEVQLDSALPAVVASQDQLTQVVLNLVLNAADACQAREGGRGRISVATSSAGGDAVLVVSDNGTGMDEETMKRAFDPYFTTKGQDRGMGLGLTLCHDIIEEHGGAIEVRSERGAGTTVRVTLPLAARR